MENRAAVPLAGSDTTITSFLTSHLRSRTFPSSASDSKHGNPCLCAAALTDIWQKRKRYVPCKYEEHGCKGVVLS